MNRRDFLASVAVGGAALTLPRRLLGSEDGRAARKPNIVYVFADQHRNCSWPGGGDPQVKTPNLDVMARQGAVFTRCISNHPLCSPYRASLLTGRYQQAHTVSGNVGGRGGLPVTETTIADLLKKAGYATGYVGKWHLYPGALEGALVPPGPHRHGFDWWRVCYNYRKRYDTRYHDDAGNEVALAEYAPKWQMDLVLEFIERNAAGPFCIYLSWHPPHPPYSEAPPQFAELYDPERIRLRPNVPEGADLAKLRQEQVQYFGHVSAMDRQVGRLMEKLTQLGIADNTIVCYSSDHGDMLGSFGRWGKNVPWDESINVPFIIRWPGGIPAGRRLDTLFSTVDITPTLLGLAGEPVLPRMQGADLSAILKGKDAPGPESAFIMSGGEVDEPEEGKPEGTALKKTQGKRAAGKGGAGRGNWRGVRTARYTYVKSGGAGGLVPWLLYDNQKDACQLHNLVDDPAAADARKELDAMLGACLKRVGEA